MPFGSGADNPTITYGYTDNGQLTSVSHTNGAFSNESYSYDDNGNRPMSGYSTVSGNELSSDGTYNYTYDAAGNMTSKTDIATGVETDYVWDDRNRLVEVDQVVSGVNTVLALYTYDALNNPIKVVEGGSTRWTAYDGNRPVLDFDGSGTLTARYLQGPMVDEVLARDTPSGGVAWYLPDRLGTVRDIIDNSGTVLDHIAYDAYGNILSQSNAGAGDRFGYAGMQTDATTGLYFDQARWYDPQSERFISVDPKGFEAGDPDLYRYVNNGPTNAIDPSGMAMMAPPQRGRIPISVIDPITIGVGGYLVGPTKEYCPTWEDVTFREPPIPLSRLVGRPEVCSAMNTTKAEMVRRGEEQGGWILWNPQTNEYDTTRSGWWPQHAGHRVRFNPPIAITDYPDKSDGYDFDGDKDYPEAKPLSGWVIVGMWHTHTSNNPAATGQDQDVARKRCAAVGIPSIIVTAPDTYWLVVPGRQFWPRETVRIPVIR